MKITLVSLDNWGYNQHICNALKQKGHQAHHIDFHDFEYRYPNPLFKAYNFFLKAFFGKNLKNIYYGKEIAKRLQQLGEKQDIILVIKGDFIDPDGIRGFKKHTKKLIGFFNDSIYRCPKIVPTLDCFDQVYSFEKDDCKKYNLQFAPNWIFNAPNQPNENTGPLQYDLFNVSSKDKRHPLILKIARQFKALKMKYRIVIVDKNRQPQDGVLEYTTKKLTLDEVSALTQRSKALLDISREGQKGLTFRTFEAMGLAKKLITTNADVKQYDFYNPENILVIGDGTTIEKSFFETPYQPVPENIYKKYTVEEWVVHVFNLK